MSISAVFFLVVVHQVIRCSAESTPAVLVPTPMKVELNPFIAKQCSSSPKSSCAARVSKCQFLKVSFKKISRSLKL